jgi:DNA-nicking Smr family endonuclease
VRRGVGGGAACLNRRRRPLSEEERALWERVAETAEPLRPQQRAAAAREVERMEAEAKPKPRPKPEAGAKPVVAMPAYVPPPQTAPAPAAIDRKTRARLTRGRMEVDARIDLHGLRQDAAHHRLRRFLVDGQDAGHRLVLVITGKGSTASPTDFGREERGVLKRSVPAWLDSPELRPLVAGYDVAGPRHGGSGALYVRIRRKRG